MGRVHAAGIFIVNVENKILVGHPTGHSETFFSVPKGKIEEGETAWEAGKRETYEETNVIIPDDSVSHELPSKVYKHKKKELHPFVYLERENLEYNLDLIELKCNSNVPESRGGFPEMDSFYWKDIPTLLNEKLLHPTQLACLAEIQEILDKI